MEQECKQEIADLHRFFEEWFTGRLPDRRENFERMTAVIAPGFVMIGPGGSLVERATLIKTLRGAHGTWGSEHSIEIRAIELRRMEGLLGLVTYEEWHHAGGESKGRSCSAWLRRLDGLPNGIEWLHVHETWLP